MIQDLSTVRITESELARDVHGYWKRSNKAVEVIVEQNHRPVAVIRLPKKAGRPISECIAAAKAYEEKLGYRPVPDPDFAKDVEDGIRERSQPFNPPSWD